MTAGQPAVSNRRPIAVLVVSNLLGGVGVASGVAVGGLIAESLGGTAVAGLGQATSVLGAAIAAIPLASLAAKRGRRTALSLGYAIATIGAALVIASVISSNLVVMLMGLGLFGVSNAVNLQTRYAAADHASPATRARSMSIVIWATTVGAVAGPNLTAPGNNVGLAAGLPNLAGPYLFSVVAFGLGAIVLAVFLPKPKAPTTAQDTEQPLTPTLSTRAALRWAFAHRQARFAVTLTAIAHAVMVLVMVMTPVHMQHHGMSLELVGIVISLHVLGMFALSPVFGILADRIGAVTVSWLGIGIFVAALIMGFVAGAGFGGTTMTAIALVALGLGWSACLISASARVTSLAPDPVRLPLQGATDAGMNFAGAGAAALAGPVLAWGGFEAINALGFILLAPAIIVGLLATSRVPAHNETQPTAAD